MTSRAPSSAITHNIYLVLVHHMTGYLLEVKYFPNILTPQKPRGVVAITFLPPLPSLPPSPCNTVGYHHQHHHHHHHHQSLFIHDIVSFYMVFLGIVFKNRLKYSKELFDYNVKIQKLTLLIIRVTMSHGVLK